MQLKPSNKSDSDLQTLSRGLSALRFISTNGPSNTASVARQLQVPRTNAFRIVQTLMHEGYIERVPGTTRFAVTLRARELSTGYDDEAILTAVAREPIQQLASRLVWPIALATPFGLDMLVRIATDFDSPVALTRVRPGYVTPMLQTTTGLLFLALSTPNARDEIVSAIASANALSPFFSSRADLRLALTRARRDGYFLNETRFPESSLGVPLVYGSQVLGGIVMRYIKKAVSRERAIRDFLPQLKKLSDGIVELYADAQLKNNRSA